MGLDQWLSKKTYVKNWSYMSEEEQTSVTVMKGGELHPDIQPARVSHIVEEIAYWRKANQIHKFMVERVQDGNDDCREYYVPIKVLRELVDVCKQVLSTVETVEGDVNHGTLFLSDGTSEKLTEKGQVVAQVEIAKNLLPTAPGFFFGKTDYDEDYLFDLQYTVDTLEPVLAQGEDFTFYYSSSW
jgi:hypothetical protein